jgi:hypothetical protein
MLGLYSINEYINTDVLLFFVEVYNIRKMKIIIHFAIRMAPLPANIIVHNPYSDKDVLGTMIWAVTVRCTCPEKCLFSLKRLYRSLIRKI